VDEIETFEAHIMNALHQRGVPLPSPDVLLLYAVMRLVREQRRTSDAIDRLTVAVKQIGG
jgi:hypothetical protein